MTFDYKKYSLEQLDNWMHDAISGDATPTEIYDCILKVVRETYYHHKDQTSRAYELLSKLNGDDGWTVEDVMKEKEYYEPSMPPWGHSDLEYGLQYTDEEISAMCDAVEKDKVKKWLLPVEQSFDEYFVSFPDDLLEAANLKEGDQVEWVDNKDGSYTLRKS